MHVKSSKPPLMFQCDAVDTSPDLGDKMSSKPSKWLFDIKTWTTWMKLEREFSVTGFIFTYVQKYFYGPLMGGDCPHGSVTDWDFSQSKWYTCWQHTAVKSTLRLQLCVVHYGKHTVTHVVRAVHQWTKVKCKSFRFGYFSSETSRQNCSLSRCLFSLTKLSACT